MKRNVNLTWHGIYPAVLTPFKENQEIDYDMLLKNMNAQIDAGINGVVMSGTLGETSTLDSEEKLELVRFARKHLPADFPVITTVAESSTRRAVHFAKESEKAGADGIMLLPPLQYRASDKEVLEFMTAVITATPLSILIYNNPVDYGIRITMDMFEVFSQYENVHAMKESTRDLTNVTRVINRFGDRFKILGGVDTIALETQLMGGCGQIAGLVNAFPRETVTYFKLVEAGRVDEAIEIYRWFMPLLELDIVPKLVQYIKLAAAAEGIGTPYVRAPRLPLPEDDRKRVQKLIDDCIRNRPDLEKFSVDKTAAV